MKKDVKHYFAVGGILCAIGATSALLIGLSHLATKDTIAENNIKAEQKALKRIYPDKNIDWKNTEKVKIKGSKLLECYWDPEYKTPDETKEKPGWIFRASGADESNYGVVTMLIEIKDDLSVGRFEIVSNTESYANTVKTNYVDKWNSGALKDYSDVKCGATKGATVIKNMADESLKYVTENILKDAKEAL